MRSCALAASPGKQSELLTLGLEQAASLAGYLRECLLEGPGKAHGCIDRMLDFVAKNPSAITKPAQGFVPNIGSA